MWIAFVWPFKILSLSSFFYWGTDCYTNIANKSQTFNPCTRFSKKINTGQSSETHFLQLCYIAPACRTAQIGDQWILWNEIFFNKSWSQLTQFSSKLFFFCWCWCWYQQWKQWFCVQLLFGQISINKTDKKFKWFKWCFIQSIL